MRDGRRVAAIFTLALSLTAVALAGCATTGVAPKSALLQVEPGMSRAQVLTLLGPPGNRTFRGDAEALQYCKKGGLVADADEFTTIWLQRDVVAGLTTQNRPIILTSCQTWPTVDWGQVPPNVRVEVRQQ